MSRVQLLCVHMFLCILYFIVLNKFCSILLYIDSQSHDITSSYWTHWPQWDLIKIWKMKILTAISSGNILQIALKLHWKECQRTVLNLGSSYGFMPPGNKPWCEPMLTTTPVATCHYDLTLWEILVLLFTKVLPYVTFMHAGQTSGRAFLCPLQFWMLC